MSNSSENKKKKVSMVDRFLGFVEKAGNLLPHPATLFAGFAILVILLSGIVSAFDVSVKMPSKKEFVWKGDLDKGKVVQMLVVNDSIVERKSIEDGKYELEDGRIVILTKSKVDTVFFGVNYTGQALSVNDKQENLNQESESNENNEEDGMDEEEEEQKSKGQQVIEPFNLVSREGLARILKDMVVNFTSFAPLGTVLVSLLGIGIAEGSGLIGAVLRLVVLSSPKKLLTFVIVFAGVISNTASEVGYVLLVPLAAVIFLAAGRHPLGGLAAAFAGVSGGYSANLLLGTIDPLLAGLSEEAARIVEPGYLVNPASNYYFMFVSTFLIAFLGTWVTEKIVLPRLGEYTGDEKPEAIVGITPIEKRGLNFAIVGSLLFTAFLLGGLIPYDGYLRGEGGAILKSPFMSGIVAFIFLGAAVAGIAYGIGAKTFKNDSDVMKGMSKSMETLGSYIVLVFFAAQFVAYFNWTNLGLILAVKGADGLQGLISLMGLENRILQTIFVMIPFIFVAAVINLVMGSASAKWAIMAPVFIPMFMLLGYSPEFTQMAYRIGDSVTNIISPMMSYFALIVAFMQRYQTKAGIGTIVSTMLPYSVVFLVGWIALLIVWIIFELPIGPGSPLEYLAK